MSDFVRPQVACGFVIWSHNLRKGSGVKASVNGTIAFPGDADESKLRGQGLAWTSNPEPGTGEVCYSHLNQAGTTYKSYRAFPQEATSIPGIVAPVELTWRIDESGTYATLNLEFPGNKKVSVRVVMGDDDKILHSPNPSESKPWGEWMFKDGDRVRCWINFQTAGDRILAYAYPDRNEELTSRDEDVEIELHRGVCHLTSSDFTDLLILDPSRPECAIEAWEEDGALCIKVTPVR